MSSPNNPAPDDPRPAPTAVVPSVPPIPSILSWAVLGLLLLATLVGAATLDRRDWPALVGDEATYLLEAQSLAWDFDLRYTRGDYDRFVESWGRKPEGLILQSSDGGATLVYGKPAVYPFFIAPFVRVSPTRGASVANALALALAAIMAARALQRRIGPIAPLWVAAWVFASVSFAYVFWVHSDLFLMCLTAIAFSLVYGPVEGDEEKRFRPGRWALIGALIGIVILSRPLYAGLVLPAGLAAGLMAKTLLPGDGRKRTVIALAAGLAGLVLLSVGADFATRGTWTSYGGDRQSFYGYTGFPGVDASAANWGAQVEERGTHGWVKGETLEIGFDPRLTAWNLLYYAAGRHVGLLPYFLPLVLGCFAWRRGAGRWSLVAAVALAAGVLFWLRPFNFYGGGGAIANRYFLPLYPALWFLAARPVKPLRGALAALAVTVLAAPFLLPLWSAPRSFPFTDGGSYRYVSAAAIRWLPFETTLSHLKPSGREDFLHHGLWIKLLTPSLRPEAEGARIALDPGQPGELLVGSERPLEILRIRLPPRGPASLPIANAEIVESLQRKEGGIALRIRPELRAHHRMWWMKDLYLYKLGIGELPEGAKFQILPEPTPPPAPKDRHPVQP